MTSSADARSPSDAAGRSDGHRLARPSAAGVLVALCLAAAQTFLLVRTAQDKSDTIDEPHDLASSVVQWKGDFSRNCDAPALPKWGFAAALRVVDPELFDPDSVRGYDPLWSRRPAELRRNLLAGRMPSILVTVLAGLFLWRAALVFGAWSGAVAHALWCFSPTVLAHGCLATFDGWAAALTCVVVWASVRVWARPSAARILVAGMACAAAAACKVPTLGLVPVVLALTAFCLRRDGRLSPRTLGAALAAFVLGFGAVLWSIYGFRIGMVDTAVPCGKTTGWTSWKIGPLPASPWVEGLVYQWSHGQSGHLGYLFGEVSSQGWWWFYLATLALKTTLGGQLLWALRVTAWLRKPAPGQWPLAAVLLAYPALLLLVMSHGSAQNGIKYILPAFPPAMLWLASGIGPVRSALGRVGLALGVVALLGGCAETLSVHPDHLMFFNRWAGGPDGGARYLVVGDDWGQDQRQLGAWQQREHPWRLYYTRYNGRPEYWGITYETPPCEPRPGYYALQAVEVHRPKRIAPGCLDWLTVEPPDARFGHSIYLYQVTRARIDRLAAERCSERPFWRSGPVPSCEAGP